MVQLPKPAHSLWISLGFCSWSLIKFVFLYRQLLLCFLLLRQRVRISALDITMLFVRFLGLLLGSPHFLFPTKGLFSLQHMGNSSQSHINTFTPSLVPCRHNGRIWPTLLLLWELSAAYQKRPSLYITHLQLAPPLRSGMKGMYVWAYLFKNTNQKIRVDNLSSINALNINERKRKMEKRRCEQAEAYKRSSKQSSPWH